MVEEMVHIERIAKAAIFAMFPLKMPGEENTTCLFLSPTDLAPKIFFVLLRVDVVGEHFV